MICWSCLQRMNRCELLAASGSKWMDDQGVEWDNKNVIILSGMQDALDALSTPQVNHLVVPVAPVMAHSVCLLSSSLSILYPPPLTSPPLCSVIIWFFFFTVFSLIEPLHYVWAHSCRNSCRFLSCSTWLTNACIPFSFQKECFCLTSLSEHRAAWEQHRGAFTSVFL